MVIFGLVNGMADLLIASAINIFVAASSTATVDAVLRVTQHSLEALTQSLGGAALIFRGIFTNRENRTTLDFILDNFVALISFLYDLVRPANVIPGQVIGNGAGNTFATEFPPGRQNPYNELDLDRAENRHAVVYQIQRLLMCLANIIRLGRAQNSGNTLDTVEMNVKLQSDFDQSGNPPQPTHVSECEESPHGEKWFFINGIANERVWFEGSCDKICNIFQREVVGIFNRSDSLLWDLVECCGERGAAGPNPLLQQTRSSMAAQDAIKEELERALQDNKLQKVVVIAHSQGCLLLRLALIDLVTQGLLVDNMQQKLRVFTFGNPSIDWRVGRTDLVQNDLLSSFSRVTEHYAHQLDFVARLGIVTHQTDPGSGYENNSVFYSNNGRGHLFGAHYPLGATAYQNGGNSVLLRAVNGGDMD